MRPGDLAAHNGRVGKVLVIVEHTARMQWVDDGSTGYVRAAALTSALPEPVCSVEQALDFVAKAEADCAAAKGTKVATPLRVLRALASAARRAA